jgi:hypothetical protein
MISFFVPGRHLSAGETPFYTLEKAIFDHSKSREKFRPSELNGTTPEGLGAWQVRAADVKVKREK